MQRLSVDESRRRSSSNTRVISFDITFNVGTGPGALVPAL